MVISNIFRPHKIIGSIIKNSLHGCGFSNLIRLFFDSRQKKSIENDIFIARQVLHSVRKPPREKASAAVKKGYEGAFIVSRWAISGRRTRGRGKIPPKSCPRRPPPRSARCRAAPRRTLSRARRIRLNENTVIAALSPAE